MEGFTKVNLPAALADVMSQSDRMIVVLLPEAFGKDAYEQLYDDIEVIAKERHPETAMIGIWPASAQDIDAAEAGQNGGAPQ